MPYQINKPTSRELRERLAASTQGDPRIRGRVRTTEEGHDIERRLAKEGESFDKPFMVSADAPESKQARVEIAQRIPQFASDPERYEEHM